MKSLFLSFLFLAGCRPVFPGNGTPVSIKPAGGGWTTEALAALDAGARMWDDTGAHLRVNDATAAQTIEAHLTNSTPLLTECSDNCDGVYDVNTGEVWVRPANFAGLPIDPKKMSPYGMAQTFAHELGHAIGLNHVAVGIMQPSSAYFEELQDDDYKEYTRVWN